MACAPSPCWQWSCSTPFRPHCAAVSWGWTFSSSSPATSSPASSSSSCAQAASAWPPSMPTACGASSRRCWPCCWPVRGRAGSCCCRRNTAWSANTSRPAPALCKTSCSSARPATSTSSPTSSPCCTCGPWPSKNSSTWPTRCSCCWPGARAGACWACCWCSACCRLRSTCTACAKTSSPPSSGPTPACGSCWPAPCWPTSRPSTKTAFRPRSSAWCFTRPCGAPPRAPNASRPCWPTPWPGWGWA